MYDGYPQSTDHHRPEAVSIDSEVEEVLQVAKRLLLVKWLELWVLQMKEIFTAQHARRH